MSLPASPRSASLPLPPSRVSSPAPPADHTSSVGPVGGDALTIRTDGVGILNVRNTIETREEALIYAAYTGVAELGADGYERFLRGDLPPLVPLRVVPRHEGR